jgi:hypothetical protein
VPAHDRELNGASSIPIGLPPLPRDTTVLIKAQSDCKECVWRRVQAKRKVPTGFGNSAEGNGNDARIVLAPADLTICGHPKARIRLVPPRQVFDTIQRCDDEFANIPVDDNEDATPNDRA